MENKERTIKPKPKMTKAERRELQEKQRAAKAAKSSTEKHGVGVMPTSNSRHGQSNAPLHVPNTGKTSAQKQVGGEESATEIKVVPKVHMFSHLEHKRAALPVVSKGDIHPSILALGRKYVSGEVTGATARAVAMLMAFKQVVLDYSTPPDKMLSWDLDKKLRPMMQYLIDCRSHSVSMGNAYKALRNLIAKSPPSLPEQEAKASIVDKINEFINTRITLAAREIAKNAITKIREGDVILTYGRSALVESILVAAQQTNRASFRVIIVDSRPGVEGRHLADTLSAEGIPCTYVLLTAISYIMREVTKVFLGASAMMSNGTVLSRVGTAVVAMMARSHNLPVMFCCETYKFCERVQLDSIVYNELGEPENLIPESEDAEELKVIPGYVLLFIFGRYAAPSVAQETITHRGIILTRCFSIDTSKTIVAVTSNVDLGYPSPRFVFSSFHRLKLLNLRYDLTPIKYVTLVITEFGFLPPTSVPVLIREMTRREDKDDKYNM